MSTQEKMRDLLSKSGVPAKEIKCYGSQVMVTCWSRDAASRFQDLLTKFCGKVRGPIQSLDYNQQNLNTVLRPSTHKVWRVWGTI